MFNARIEEGQLFSCGSMECGQLGDGMMESRYRDIPMRIESLFGTKIVDIAVGFDHNIALSGNGFSFADLFFFVIKISIPDDVPQFGMTHPD